MSIPTIRELHRRGLSHYINEHEEADRDKVGTLRGGNAGSLPVKGVPIGNCPRLAHLRRVGISVEPGDEQSQTMHDGGLANEEIFFERVNRGLPDGYSLVHEEDHPSSWNTNRGTAVTGRPDGILLGPDGIARRGIELKGVFSFTTAVKVLTDKPKIDNLIQSAQYMMALELPEYELVYVNRNWFAVPEDRARLVPMFSPHVQYNYFKYRPYLRDPSKFTCARIDREEFESVERIEYISAGRHGRVPEYLVKPANILPFTASYLLRFNDNGKLEWKRTEDGAEWVTTRVTRDSIINYYEVTDSLTDPDASLPPRIKKADSKGYPSNYNACDYCSLSSICSSSSINTSGRFMAAVLDEMKKRVDTQ